MAREFKFGEYLLQAGVITHAQLDEALRVQQEHMQDAELREIRPIGEIVHELFQIPTGDIESVFIHYCLASLTEEKLESIIETDPRLKEAGVDFVNSIIGINIEVPACNRRRSDLEHMIMEGGKLACRHQESLEYRIDGHMKIVIQLFDDRTVERNCAFAYKMKESRMMLFNDVLNGLREDLIQSHEAYRHSLSIIDGGEVDL